MTREQQLALIATALFASLSQTAGAATVTVTTSSPISFNGGGSPSGVYSYLYGFSDIQNADQLVSISGGNVTNGEGGTFSVDVNYVGNSTARLFTTTITPGQNLALTSIPTTTFPTGTINGITFNLPWASNLSIPSGTRFTFHTLDVAVPEPSSWAMMLAGFGLIGLSLRQRASGASRSRSRIPRIYQRNPA